MPKKQTKRRRLQQKFKRFYVAYINFMYICCKIE